ncbi:MAG: hypothetical protein E7435_02345 [Ruminococcaceae bacterium]|nr:hypothetical protein [Oscillospiraceae bacterium]
MKKTLVVILVLVMALLAAGCSKHKHELTKVEGYAATCTATGVADYWTCSGCDKLFKDADATAEYIKDNTLPQQLITEMKPHSYVDDKDCTTDDKCKNCDAVKEAEHEKHEAKADDGDCTTAITCKNCSVVLVEKQEHTGGTATCSEKAKCTNCGKVYGSVDPNAHLFNDVHSCFSDDFSTCTITAVCAYNEAHKVYETVATYYSNGKACAKLDVSGIAVQTIDLTNLNRFSASVYEVALTYMIANGESDIEVMFPILKNCSGPVYDAARATAKWYLEGCQIPEEIPNTVNTVMELIDKLPL